jgi:hypothetical protein
MHNLIMRRKFLIAVLLLPILPALVIALLSSELGVMLSNLNFGPAFWVSYFLGMLGALWCILIQPSTQWSLSWRVVSFIIILVCAIQLFYLLLQSTYIISLKNLIDLIIIPTPAMLMADSFVNNESRD